ncbi:MAG: EAL domain-containing protein [Synechococcales bacterium]|nr:EAL domain-containing protein [Synechococcales bacterium]
MKTILVIEDEKIIRENVLSILEQNGFRGLGAVDGLDGITQARTQQPDLILCDIRMPRYDGYEVLKTLRNEAATATTPFIFLSARSDRSGIRLGMNAGADDYLPKPFTTEELLAAIQACLKKKEQLQRTYHDQVSDIKLALEKVAHWDTLTNLPNAQWFQKHLQSELQAYCPSSAQNFPQSQDGLAVVLLKVNNYSSVMLTFRHDVGDRFLQAMSDRLRVAALPGTLARLSEDEFGISLPEVTSIVDIREFVEMLLSILTVPYHINDQEIRIRVSVGIALAPAHSRNVKELITQAGTAMRWSRQQDYLQGYQFYSPVIANAEAERHQLATELTRALEQSELRVLYQPQINLRTQQLYGVEALVRWCHPERGWISPEQFIGVAEEFGLIGPLGEWVLRTACQQVAQWQRRRSMKLSVNLSMRQLQQPNFVLQVGTILQTSGLQPHNLVLELTETAVMEQVESTIQKLRQLKQLGVKCSIDDFGTGYSSLSYLSQLPIDELKIDRSFVNQVNTDRSAHTICSAIIAMARSLDLWIVAEGIETQLQSNFLRQQGCHAGQGFFYALPLTATQLEKLQKQGLPWRLSRRNSEPFESPSLEGHPLPSRWI